MKRSAVDITTHKAHTKARESGESLSSEYRGSERRVRQYHTCGAPKRQRRVARNARKGARRSINMQLHDETCEDVYTSRERKPLSLALFYGS